MVTGASCHTFTGYFIPEKKLALQSQQGHVVTIETALKGSLQNFPMTSHSMGKYTVEGDWRQILKRSTPLNNKLEAFRKH